MTPAQPTEAAPTDDLPSPLRARGRRTRARFLEAGAIVFASKGLHAARVDDVVAVADTSHGAFYLYFSSKEDLFDSLVAEVADHLQELIDDLPPIRDTPSGRAALREWLARFAELYELYGAIIRTWTEAELFGDRSGQRGNDALGGLAAAMTANIRIPKRSGLDPAIASLALMTMVERVNYYTATGQLQATADEVLDTLVDVIAAAVFR
jgi:AcrR family transcriptional regulator